MTKNTYQEGLSGGSLPGHRGGMWAVCMANTIFTWIGHLLGGNVVGGVSGRSRGTGRLGITMASCII